MNVSGPVRRVAPIVGCALLAVTSLAACSGGPSAWDSHLARSGEATAPDRPAASTTLHLTPPTQQSSPQLVPELTGIALQDSDVANGFSVALMPGGDSLSDPTLDVCNASFGTEKDRVARRQYEVDQGDQFAGVSNEVVAYDTPAHAQAAIAQAYQAAESCRPTVVVQDDGQDVTVHQQVLSAQRDVATLPSPANLVIFAQQQVSAQTTYGAAIYQVHGRFLDAIYGSQDHAFGSADVRALTQLATVTGARLMQTS